MIDDFIYVYCEKNGEVLFNSKKVNMLKKLSDISTLVEMDSGTELIVNLDIDTLKTEINSKNSD